MRRHNVVAVAFIIAVTFLFAETGHCMTRRQKKQASCSAQKPAVKPQPAKTLDTDKDGNPDVWYYAKDKKIYKVDVDSNKDGKPDIFHQKTPDGRETILIDTNKDGRSEILITAKNGVFESAVVDDNKDFKFDKIINNANEFKNWLNKNEPEVKTALDKLRVTEKGVGVVLFEF